MVTHDGVTIAQEIHLKNQFESRPAGQEAAKTNDIVGDDRDRTVARHRPRGHASDRLRRQPVLVRRASTSRSRGWSPPSDLARVTAFSANDDDMEGAVIAKALRPVGDGGIVTVEQTTTHGMRVDFVEGFEFDNGYLSPYMVTDPGSLQAILDDPCILLCSEKITKVQELMAAAGQADA